MLCILQYFQLSILNMLHSGKVILLLLFLLFVRIPVNAQHDNVPLSRQSDKEILNYYDQRAKDFVAKNLNRFAVDRLRAYDYMLDSLYRKELRDTLATIEKNYLSKAGTQKSTIAHQKSRIVELTAQKASLENRYWTLIRKALLSFALWLAIVLLLLQFRRRRLSKARQRLEDATLQLNSLEQLNHQAEELFNQNRQVLDDLMIADVESVKLATIVSEAASSLNAPPEWQNIVMRTEQLKKAVSTEFRIAEAIVSQSSDPAEEKTETDINKLCEQYLEMAWRGIEKSEGFNCQISRDFEKRLPVIRINAAATGTLLLNVFMNAFQSVMEKNEKGIKGYQPKVSVSTRILPRFLQIRVRDNGLGMTDSVLEKATEEFFTTKPLESAAGLGLAISNKIIMDMQKGEMKIETEEGNSTDVYIKFFI